MKLEAVVVSGAWVALTALALSLAAARALGLGVPVDLGAVIFLGSFAVYAADRLRDRGRETTKTMRRDFLLHHERALTAVAASTGATAVGLGLVQPPAVIAVLASVVVLALLHARLQHLPGVKPTYIALAWWMVVVVLPVARAGAPWRATLAELGPVALSVLANVLACDAADGEAEARRLGPRRTWWLARLVAATGVVAALLNREPLQPLVAIPGATLLALVPYRPEETYTSAVVDGALLVGGIVAWIWLGWG